jgi:glycerol-3-phosphate acyltransferase PlsX
LTEPYTLAVDAMGGDHAPAMVVAGLEIAAERHPRRALPAGRRRGAAGAAAGGAQARRGGLHAAPRAGRDQPSDMKPTAALRMRQASMRVAIDAVAAGEASGVVSAGNTGALLALAKIVIKTLPGHRPAGDGGDRALGARRRRDARPRRQRPATRATWSNSR